MQFCIPCQHFKCCMQQRNAAVAALKEYTFLNKSLKNFISLFFSRENIEKNCIEK